MPNNRFKRIIQQLAKDCELGNFIPYEESDLRAEAYARLKNISSSSKLAVNTEVRLHPYGRGGNASKCDVVVWSAWGRGDSDLNLNARPPEFAVEFKYWGQPAPTKMLAYFEADILRLTQCAPLNRSFAFLYVARTFRHHDIVLKKARALGSKHGVSVAIIDGTQV